MIHEVDESLRNLLKRDVVNGADVEIAFDAPTRQWSSKRSTPAVDLFLYDIREDRSQRKQGQVRERDDKGLVVRQRDPTRRLRLSYLVTAWTQRPEDEHRLLSSLLDCFIKYDDLPVEMLVGSLALNATTVGVAVGVPSVEDRHVSDLWTAIGGDLRPALDLVAIAPIQPGLVRPPAPPVLERTRINIGHAGSIAPSRPRRGISEAPATAAQAASPAAPTAGETISAGESADDFDAPSPTNQLPRGRTIRVSRIPPGP